MNSRLRNGHPAQLHDLVNRRMTVIYTNDVSIGQHHGTSLKPTLARRQSVVTAAVKSIPLEPRPFSVMDSGALFST